MNTTEANRIHANYCKAMEKARAKLYPIGQPVEAEINGVLLTGEVWAHDNEVVRDRGAWIYVDFDDVFDRRLIHIADKIRPIK